MSDTLPAGRATPQTSADAVNATNYAIAQAMRRMQTATVVRVEKCTRAGEAEEVGFVDVTPLVSQVDAFAQEVQHAVIHNLPYVRVQGGKNAVIIDPEKGDIGIAVFASRDISRLKTDKKQAPPASWRAFNWADGMYIGGLLNEKPEQYVRFHSDGIEILSPKNVTLDAPSVEVKCKTLKVQASSSVTFDTPEVKMTGKLTVQQDATAEGISVAHHTHTCPDGGTSQPR